MLALKAGCQTAAPRLVAGYARPGRDNGLALWWVAKNRAAGALPGQGIPPGWRRHGSACGARNSAARAAAFDYVYRSSIYFTIE
jgi:hypothetical protein